MAAEDPEELELAIGASMAAASAGWPSPWIAMPFPAAPAHYAVAPGRLCARCGGVYRCAGAGAKRRAAVERHARACWVPSERVPPAFTRAVAEWLGRVGTDAGIVAALDRARVGLVGSVLLFVHVRSAADIARPPMDGVAAPFDAESVRGLGYPEREAFLYRALEVGGDAIVCFVEGEHGARTVSVDALRYRLGALD